MTLPLHFIWNPSTAIDLGFIQIHFYSLMFLVAFGTGYFVMKKIYEREGESQENLDKILMYAIIATLLGARLGHVFFYDWEYFKHRPEEILLPVKFRPEFEFTGFRGLASHGAAIGIILAMFFYSKWVIKKPILWILDRVVIPVTIGGMFVRIGNFFNSEIYGHVSSSSNPFAIKFVKEEEFWRTHNIFEITGINNLEQAYRSITDNPAMQSVLDQIPLRHPTQLYEAVGYFFLFWLLMYLYWKTDIRNYTGKLFGVFLVFLWTIRFVVEFVKESQGGFEKDLGILSTGQWLSVPFIIVGIYLWITAKKKANY